MVSKLEQHVFVIKYREEEIAKKYIDLLLLNMSEVLSESLYPLSSVLSDKALANNILSSTACIVEAFS